MRKNLILAAGLTIPLLAFFAGYFFNHAPGLVPTGFIQYDNVAYIAYARQYLDAEGLRLFYSNPFNDASHYSAIYFQPQTVLFALLMKCGLPPGWILPLFTILCSFVCFLLIIAIYDHIVPDKKNRTLNLWLFAWGGGLLVLAGAAYHFLQGSGNLRDELFVIDPEYGWWGLSLGRSLFFSCEAYYHALFLGAIYLMLKRKWAGALILVFLLSLSHPFTGIEISLIVCAWVACELLFNRKEVPAWFGVGALLVAGFHIWYYLFYLVGFPDHHSVAAQYSLGWGLRFYRMLPAYGIVAALAIASLWQASLKSFMQVRSNRLFACWFLVAFLLANHEVFLPPKQPIHFTRGYIWTSLFLLGLPALQRAITMMKNRRRYIVLALFASLFLFDNFLWIANRAASRVSDPYTSHVTVEQQSLFQAVNRESSNRTLVISGENTLSYLSTVYTSAYPLYSHLYTTPFAEVKKNLQDSFVEQGTLDSSLASREIIFILTREDSTAIRAASELDARIIFESERYLVCKKDAD